MAKAATKAERVSLRIDAEHKRTLERAAAHSGSSLSSFVITTALAAAKNVIEARDNVTLSPRDWQAFFDALANPPAANPNLRRALQRHEERYG